jgi:sodium/potassium-transporting ATPase subunit alpha
VYPLPILFCNPIDSKINRASWLRIEHPDFISVSLLIVNCVSVAIAFIPEGLPIALTAGLTITANLMKKNMVLCKSLKTVETLGSVSVVCSDKTGTLTEGKMAVSDCAMGADTMTLDEAQKRFAAAPLGEARGRASAVKQLRALASLCNAADFDAADAEAPVARRKAFGDATDQAILRFAEHMDVAGVAYMRSCWRRTFDLAFNSKNKFMMRCFAVTRPESLPYTLSEAECQSFGSNDT